MTETATAEVRPMEAHKSKWGYHPCSHEVFLLLKRLNKHYEKARTGYHIWSRWLRKAPQNRVIRKTLRDEKGMKVGVEIVGPRPEPKLCPVFVEKVMTKVRYHQGEWHDKGIEVEQTRLVGLAVAADYASARYPKSEANAVRPLTMTVETIREMLAKFEESPEPAKI